ncbi:MAG: ABC transporter substrate-binding protein [Clostridiales bacterium]|nr:ABC transporter substrate-binding protein [Clostridiales bacterium]
MPKFVKRALLLLVVAAMLPVSLYGCTGDTEPSQSPTASAQSGELPNGNSVTVGIAQDLSNLDPQLAKTAGIREVLFNIFEGLVKASPDGSVIPAVASDYEISEDATTYTFTLREGVTFHNGEIVTIEDVVYSLERCAGSENDGKPLVSAFSNVSKIEATDDSHVVITLAEPSLEFLNALTAAIIPKDSGPTITETMIGTGPFQFVSYAPQDSLVMEKYDGYWNGEKAAKLDKVTFKIVPDVNAMVVGLKGGTLDMVVHLPNNLEGEVENDFTVHEDTMKLVQALYINNAVEPFDNELVRQAMYYAIDVDQIIDFVCGGAGVPTGTSMYPAQEKYFMPELAGNYAPNVEKAKELLAQAGYPDGFTMTITAPSNYAQHVDTAQVIIEQLKAVGITAELVQVEWESWVSDIYRGRDYQTTVCGISADDMTAREMLVRYMSDNQKNFINFADEEFDDVLTRAMAATDEEEQVTLYKRAEEILNEKAASLWIQDLCDLVVMNPALDGFTFYRTYVIDMSTISYK